MQTLTTQQVHSLNSKHGAGLEESKGKMYVQSFLINSQQNQAGDPHPFRVDGKLLPKLARTAIGMPWLPYPKSDGNHQRPIGAAAFTADGIKQHQQQFAGGEIVAQYTNEGTGNVNVIIDVFPEYQEAVRSKKIPAFVSPMIFPHDMTPEGLVKEGEILHLQSVHHPGYAPDVAKINSVCEGNGLKQCMTQMKALAASGKLAPFQSKVKNYISKNVSPADKTKMGKVQIGGETNWYDANKNEFQFSPEYKHNFPNPEKLPIVVQHEIGHMHWHHTLTPAQRKMFAKNVPKDLEISPYAIQHKRMLYKAVSNFRKDKSSKNRKAVKRAYGEYIREVFAILHSMRKEPDYVQRLKTDGLKQGMSAYMGALGAAGPLDDAAFTKKVSRVNNSMTKPNRRGHIPNKILKQTNMDDVVRRHGSHHKRTTKLKPAKYAPNAPPMRNQEKHWIPALQMGSINTSLSPAHLKANKKTFNDLMKRNPGLATTLAAREKVLNSQNRKNQRLFKQAPTLWRGGNEKELEALYRKGAFVGTGNPRGFDYKATSLDKGVAGSFRSGIDTYLMKIDAKPLRDKKMAKLVKYTHGPTLEKYAERYDSNYTDKYLHEKEVRLRPGTQFKSESGKKLIKQIHFNTSSIEKQKELSAKYGDLADKITFGDDKALGAVRGGKAAKGVGRSSKRAIERFPYSNKKGSSQSERRRANYTDKWNDGKREIKNFESGKYDNDMNRDHRIKTAWKQLKVDRKKLNRKTKIANRMGKLPKKTLGKKKPKMSEYDPDDVGRIEKYMSQYANPKRGNSNFVLTNGSMAGNNDLIHNEFLSEAVKGMKRPVHSPKGDVFDQLRGRPSAPMRIKQLKGSLYLNPTAPMTSAQRKWVKDTLESEGILGSNFTVSPDYERILSDGLGDRMRNESKKIRQQFRMNYFGAKPKKTLRKKKPKTFVDNIESGLKKNKTGTGGGGFILRNGEMVKNHRDQTHEESLKEAIKKSYKKGFPSFQAYEISYPTQTLRKQKNPPVRYGHKSIELFGDPTPSQIKSMKDHVISNRGKVKYLEMSHMDLNDKKDLAENRMKKRLGIDYLGEDGQSDRAAERYKAEQSEDKILTKKNTSAKYRRQVKDDRSAYARKNPKYAALRPELRKYMSLKTRRANRMGIPPNASMIKTAFSNVLGNQTA